MTSRICNIGTCLWSDNDRFCAVLQKASVPLDGKWPLLILYLRGLKEDRFLSEVQKSKMQEILLRTLQDKLFTDERYTDVQKEMHAIVNAPFELKLREIAREAAALTEEVNKILGTRKQEVISVAESMEQGIANGEDPREILAALREALRDVAVKMEQDTNTLTDLSRKDSLTGLANRRSFDEFIEDTAQLWEKEKIPAALILFDIDHFKNFNDTYGHLVGDQVLRALASKVRRIIEPLSADGTAALLCRYGGEEFTVILRGPIAAQSLRISEAIRKAVEGSTLLLRDANGEVLESGLRVTVSVGVAAMWSGWKGAFLVNLIDCADKALYHAKRSGRNCTVQYTPEEEQMYTLAT